MLVTAIYKRFNLPPNLVRHMAEVAVVCQFVLDHWTGPEKVNQKLVIESALVHDLANVIKFKRPFKGDLEKEAEYWQKVRNNLVDRYGDNVQQALVAMIKEVKLNHLLPILIDMASVWIPNDSLNSNLISVEARILELADCCVTPDGIVGFDIRMQDLYQRYNFTEKDVKAQRLIANKDWVQQRLDVDLTQVDWGKVREKVGEYGEYEMVDQQILFQ